MASEAQATRQTAAGGDDLHRLRDIVVEEVSLVDRAANKRRFLVVKRSEDMADESRPGTGRRVAKAARKPKGEQEETEKARRRAAPEEDDEEVDETKAASRRTSKEDADSEEEESDGDDAKKSSGRRASKADDEEDDDEEDEDDSTEKSARRGGAAKADDEDEDADEEGKSKARRAKADDENDDEETEKSARPGGAAKAGQEADDAEGDETAPWRSKPKWKARKAALVLAKPAKNGALRQLAQALERLMAVANRVKGADEPDEDSEPTVPDDLGDELDGIGELLEDVGDRLEGATEKAVVKKAGARMAKDRLDRFQKALALLSEVLKELTDVRGPPEPTAGAAQSVLAKRATGRDPRDTAPGLRELAAGIGELTRVVKRQEEQFAEQLASLRKARGLSNAISVEGGPRRAEPQDVSWPLDLNRPISRDSVAKAISFFEE